MKMPWTLKRENENLSFAMEQLKQNNDRLWESKDELENEVLRLRKQQAEVLGLLRHVEGLGDSVGHDEIRAILAPRLQERST